MNPIVYFSLFLKAALFSSGGMATLPSLHQDLLAAGWAQEADFSTAIAIGQIAPGPSGLWVVSLGYLTYGPLGAVLSLVAIIIPPLLVLLVAAAYRRVEDRRWVRGLIRGLTLTGVGLLLTVITSSISVPTIDWRGYILALVACGLALSGLIHVVLILILAGAFGFFFL